MDKGGGTRTQERLARGSEEARDRRAGAGGDFTPSPPASASPHVGPTAWFNKPAVTVPILRSTRTRLVEARFISWLDFWV